MPDEDPIRRRDQQQTPTLRELAMVLFRQRRAFVWVAALVFAVALLYALFGTTYQADMKILVRRGRADDPVSSGENAPLDLTRLAISEEELNLEVELLRDSNVLEKVVQETGIGGRDWLHFLRMNEGSSARVERTARRLAKTLKIEPIKKTNLIGVSYSADDPQLAARVLRALENVYLEKHLTVHRPSGELHFFSEQAAESRRQLDAAKQQVLRFASEHGVVSAGLQRDLTLQKLSEVDARHRQTKIDLVETGRRVSELEEQVAQLPDRTTTQVRTADNPELLKELKSSLLVLELKRTQLLTKFEPNHRLVQEVQEQIARTESVIAAESLKPLRDETTDKNAHYEWAASELQRARVELKALQARETAMATEAESYRQIAAKFGEDAITQEDLLSREKTALENYLLYVKKQEQARMNDALDERGIVNVAIAQEPVAPALPMLSAWIVVAVGLIAAGASGTGAAFVVDYLSPGFRDPDDVSAYLNSPVLACVPKRPCGRLSA